MRNIKLRYYLRALGLGIVVTALILGIAGSKETEMTDAQIRERALELGMVDSDAVVLSDLQRPESAPSQTLDEEGMEPQEETVEDSLEETAEAITEETVVEGTEEATAETMLEDAEENGEETVAGTAEEIEEETIEEIIEETAEETIEETVEEIVEETTEEVTEETVENKESETVILTIKSGASSDSVSRQLFELGLITDVSAYDSFLCDNGYSKSIRVGTFEIPMGATEEEIAKIITGKR